MNMKEIEIRCELTEAEYKRLQTQFFENNGEAKEQKDTYYCAKAYYENGNTEECPYVVRTRKSSKGTYLTYKSFVNGGKSWIEEETKVDNLDAVEKILNYLDQRAYLSISKTRYTRNVECIEINLDQIEKLGYFVELEIMGEDIEKGKEQLAEYAKKTLGLEVLRIIDKGYVQLMEECQNGIKGVL